METPSSSFVVLFDQAVGSNPPVHYLCSLETGEQALLARIALIRDAKRAIYLQTFIWTNDESGRLIAYELLQAAKRGVKVRIIIDSWVSIGDPGLMAFLNTAHPNISVKHYNVAADQLHPSALELVLEIVSNFQEFNHRMHNKSFIVDEAVCIVGGRNYGNAYFDRGRTRNFRDREAMLVGPIAQQVTKSFFDFWNSPYSCSGLDLKDVQQWVERSPLSADSSFDDFQTGGLFESVLTQADDPTKVQDRFIGEMLPVTEVEFFSDSPGEARQNKLSHKNRTVSEVGQLWKSANDTILLQTPYFVLDGVHYGVLESLRSERPKLRVIVSTNSLASSDNLFTYAFAYRERNRYFEQLRLELHEYKPYPPVMHEVMEYRRPDSVDAPRCDNLEACMSFDSAKHRHLCLHAKTFVIDDKAVWIGSINLDPRSAYVNSENGLLIFDKAFTSQIRDKIERDIRPENSWTVGISKRGRFTELLRKLFSLLTPSMGKVEKNLAEFTENF
ncbi:MAG: phospholipase D family protein, partial [Bdellovibrionales bacterium]|nr:phospholipase D family protein [Bdellovibrionales bacterium]